MKIGPKPTLNLLSPSNLEFGIQGQLQILKINLQNVLMKVIAFIGIKLLIFTDLFCFQDMEPPQVIRFKQQQFSLVQNLLKL